MNSERMRTELESFVNAGLRQGWRGWPRKSTVCLERTGGARLDGPGGLPAGRAALTRNRFGGGSDVLSVRYGLLY